MNEPLGDFIRTQRSLARLSLRQLADLAEVSNAYLSQVERNLYTPSAQVMKSIAEALHLSAATLYARAGLLDEDAVARPLDVEQAIRLDERLTDDQKDALLSVYRGFIATSPAAVD
jgi:transcriptional regulator with XRE-family HTH domain